MYDKLKQLIENHNEQYQKLNDIVHSIEKDPNKDKTELELWQQNRWQFIHNYAHRCRDHSKDSRRTLTLLRKFDKIKLNGDTIP